MNADISFMAISNGSEFRRRTPRMAAGWPGKWQLPDEEFSAWNVCQIIEISIAGVGLELDDLPTDDLVGRRLVVESTAPSGAAVTARFEGEVRHVSPLRPGKTRVGMEFVNLSETERQILDAMGHLGAVW